GRGDLAPIPEDRSQRRPTRNLGSVCFQGPHRALFAGFFWDSPVFDGSLRDVFRPVCMLLVGGGTARTTGGGGSGVTGGRRLVAPRQPLTRPATGRIRQRAHPALVSPLILCG